MELSGAHVAITGASRGLGAAFAKELALRGANLTLIARNESLLHGVAAPLDANTVVSDLLDPDAVDQLLPQVAEHAPIDIWINNAGMERTGLVAEQTAQELRDVIRLNLEVPIVLTGALLQHLRGRPGAKGMVVNVSSMAMATNTPGFATYGSSKSGLSAFTSSLRQELRGNDAKAMTVEVGTVDTDMLTSLRASSVGPYFERYRRSGLSPVMKVERVATAVADGIENDAAFVRLPRRSRFGAATTNFSRRIGDLTQTGV